jgi:prepilin-type processing-associated H-X9-DG protein
VWSAQGAKRRLRDITDGTSSSIMAAEKCLPHKRFGVDGGDNERWNNAGWDECVIRYHFPPKSDFDPTIKITGSPSDPNGGSNVWRRYFGSSHGSGLNATYADGSVRFSPFSVDPMVWMYLCVIDDGQTVNTDE